MELFIAIAMLCQVSGSKSSKSVFDISLNDTGKHQLECQQSYVHCVNIKATSMTKENALNKCILEKK